MNPTLISDELREIFAAARSCEDPSAFVLWLIDESKRFEAGLVGAAAPTINGRKGDWIQTYTGRAFWPLDPRAEEVFIEDIAHSLSLLCRFGGHCNKFYSVAEHSVLVSHFVPADLALWGLLHDASEAYLCDLPQPIKYAVSGYREAEQLVMRVICKRYGLAVDEPPAVKEAECRVLATEVEQIMTHSRAAWKLRAKPIVGLRLPLWSPEKAEIEFLKRFMALIETGSVSAMSV